ncbi:MAG: class I SAM-dependent methyltransferase [Sphingomicrobium sp.]
MEIRTYKRATGELPEMECTKQLVRLIGDVYEPGMSVLDVGCAGGHYFHGLKRVDPNVRYYGVDATERYIDFASRHFANVPNASFSREDIFKLPADFSEQFDIVYCCNVLLHLPSAKVPIHNLVRAASRYVIIRTLIADRTHLSKFLYADTFDEEGNPTDFVHQNTYSRDLIRAHVAEVGDYQVEFLADQFEADQIVREHRDYSDSQSAVTHVADGKQIAGSKVFEWEWLKITK